MDLTNTYLSVIEQGNVPVVGGHVIMGDDVYEITEHLGLDKGQSTDAPNRWRYKAKALLVDVDTWCEENEQDPQYMDHGLSDTVAAEVYLREQLSKAKVDNLCYDSYCSLGDDDDGVAWINYDLHLPDGSIIDGGIWIYTGYSDDPSIRDEVERDTYAIRGYEASEITDAQQILSDTLEEYFKNITTDDETAPEMIGRIVEELGVGVKEATDHWKDRESLH